MTDQHSIIADWPPGPFIVEKLLDEPATFTHCGALDPSQSTKPMKRVTPI